MTRFSSLLLCGAIAAATVGAPAHAVALTFNLTTKSTTVAGVSGGLTFNSTTTGDSTTVTATAWNAVQSSTQASRYTISAANIGAYSGGLGVTSGDDYGGDYNLHQIDNVGDIDGPTSTDFVLLTFNRAVTLTSLSRNAYGLPNPATNFRSNAYDNDYSVFYGATRTNLTHATAGVLPFTKLNDFFGTSCQGYTSGVCADTDSPLGATAASTTWVVAASFLGNYGGDGKIDGFKLSSIGVNYTVPSTPGGNQTPAVPESATWAQMILGFGLAGMGLRRRRRITAAA